MQNALEETDLVNKLADILRFLVPYFDAVGITWKDNDQYDNYDRIADTLFREIVLHPLSYQEFGEERSYQYDMPPYGAPWGTLCVRDSRTGQDLGPFVRLTSVKSPFDAVKYLEAGEEKSRLLPDVTFRLELTKRTG